MSHTLIFRSLATVKTVRQRWLWEDRLPLGAFCVHAGKRGQGKSIVTSSLIAKVTRGTLDGEVKGQPRRVLLLNMEEDVETVVKPRLIASGADMDLVTILERDDETTPTLEDMDAMFEGMAVETTAPYALFVIDPLQGRFGAGKALNKQEDIRPVLERLGKLSRQHQVTTLAIHHFKKGESDDILDDVTGSSAVVEVARAVLASAKVPGDQMTIFTGIIKNSNGREDAPTLITRLQIAEIRTDDGEIAKPAWAKWADWDKRTITELRKEKSVERRDELIRGSRQQKVEQAKAYLLDALKDGPRPRNTVIDERPAGLSVENVRSAKHGLGLKGYDIREYPYHHMWELPPPAADALDPPVRVKPFTPKLPASLRTADEPPTSNTH